MNLSNLWEMWPVRGPWHLSPLSGGTNNVVWRADTAHGKSYVLRVLNTMNNIPRVRYESALLDALDSQNLPFLLPRLIQTFDHDIVAIFEQENGTQAFATLSPFLSGNVVDNRSDLVIATHAGQVLAQLDNALATLATTHTAEEMLSRPAFGELTSCHPAVPAPLAAVEQLPISQEYKRHMCSLLNLVMERVPDLYNQLPQQMLHRDYDPSNILVERQQVTAVLDFEFAGRDLRVLDICVALSWWPVDVLGTGKEWAIIDSFGRGYTTLFSMTEQEILAFPDVWRLRDATSFIHRMGRYLAGLETEERIKGRVQHSLWREAWLSAYQDKLVQHALTWVKQKLQKPPRE